MAWLDGQTEADPRSRYSIIAAKPFLRLTEAADPFRALAEALAVPRPPAHVLPFPCPCGAIGWLGYELRHWLERDRTRHTPLDGVPDLDVGLYDAALLFDLAARRCWIVSTGLPETGRMAISRARDRAAWLRDLAGREPPPRRALPALGWHAELDRAGYEARVRRVLAYIQAGDIYQANLTVRHLARRPAGWDPATAYLVLRRASPAPFSAFLGGSPVALLSASPERFLSLTPEGHIETRPIKGTRPRAADPVLDGRYRADLAASIKDRAENLMIVDLLRNDLSRVARPGSVRVPSLCAVESFSRAHHLVSVVEARLRPELGAVDLLRACFPGGSITGAPKIRAMQIIDELEAARRGPYCGSILRIGFDGAMDSSIIIRTIVATQDTILAQAGGGIVADSEPAAEWEEMLVKCRPMLDALA